MLKANLRPLIIFVCLLAFSSAFAQPTRPSRQGMDQTVDLPIQLRERLIQLVDSSFGVYADVCSLVDWKAKRPTEESIRQFRSLFVAGSFHVRDFGLGLNPGTASKYISDAVALQPNGLKVYIQNPAYVSIGYDSAGVYVVKVCFIKTFFQGVNANNNPVAFKPARQVPLLITYYIEKATLDRAMIYKVDHCPKCPCARGGDKEGKVDLFVGARYGLGLANYQMNEPWAGMVEGKDKEKFAIAPALQFGVGLRYHLNPKVSLLGEIFFGKTTIKISGESLNDTIEVSDKVPTEIWKKHIRVANWQEEATLKTTEIAVGAGYQLVKTEKVTLYADALLCLGFNKFGGEAAFKADTVFIRGKYKDYQWDTETDNQPPVEYYFGAAKNEYENTAPTAEMGIAARLRPVLVFQISKNVGLRLGADFTLGLNTLFGNPDEKAALPFGQNVNVQSTLDESILTSQVQKFSMHQIGLHAGLIFKI